MFLALGNVSHLSEMLLLKLVVRSTTSPQNLFPWLYLLTKHHSALPNKNTTHALL